jgi:hypothetical protein
VGSEEHGVDEPGFVPSTITVARSMPRRWTFGVVMTTPPNAPADWAVGGFVASSAS